MNTDMTLLAELRGLGRVVICPSLCHVHVAVGPVTLCLEQEAYQQFVVMLNDSAANLEMLLEADRIGVSRPGGPCQGRSTHEGTTLEP